MAPEDHWTSLVVIVGCHSKGNEWIIIDMYKGEWCIKQCC